MKKNSLRFIAGLSAAAMFAMPMANAVAAPLAIFAEETTGTITVNNLDGSTTYNVYQILKSDLRFVNDQARTATLTALNEIGITTPDVPANKEDASFANQIAKILQELSNEQKIAFANSLAAKIGDTGLATIPGMATITADSPTATVPYGYYILVDKNAEKADLRPNATDAILVHVTAETPAPTINSKAASGAPKVDKTTNPELAEWETITIGEAPADILHVPYTIKGTFPNNIADYESYTMTIKDTLPAGVEVEDGEYAKWGVTLKAYDKTDKEPVVIDVPDPNITSNTDGRTVVSWTLNNILGTLANDTTGWSKDDLRNVTIELNYTLYVNETSLFNGEPSTTIDNLTNTVTIEYPSDPFPGTSGGTTGEGTKTTTPEDPSYLNYYNLTLSKVDDESKALTGAEFTLVRKTGEGAASTTQGSHTVSADQNGVFKFDGLVAGEYILTETVVPKGKKAIDPIEFTIVETTNEQGEAIQAVVTENHPNAAFTVKGTETTTDGKSEVTVTTSNIDLTVVNNTGPNLPLTGEAGMTVGLIVGGLIIAVSGYAVLKNKKEENA